MNARHTSRELFVLVLSQLPNIKKKVEKLQIEDLIEQATRTLTLEVASILSVARGDLIKADDDLTDGQLISNKDIVIDVLKSAVENTHSALELISYCNSLPLLFTLSQKQDIKDFTVKLIKLYQENPEKVDKIINDSAIGGWDTETMYSMDRNVLIMAVVELMNYDHTDHKIIIDEAVEISKKYGSAESPTFVNGVLSGVVKTLGISDSKSTK
jgi:transcription antitermination factor NusB